MNPQEIKTLVASILNKNILTVISTVSKNGKPEAALVGFGNTPDLELIFGTSTKTRKYANLKDNKKVAFVIGWTATETVQYEGVAQELTGEEKERLSEIYFAKNPIARKFATDPSLVYFKVTPTWIRYTDVTKGPAGVMEVKF